MDQALQSDASIHCFHHPYGFRGGAVAGLADGLVVLVRHWVLVVVGSESHGLGFAEQLHEIGENEYGDWSGWSYIDYVGIGCMDPVKFLLPRSN